MSWHMPRSFAYRRNVIGMGKFVVDKRSACDTRRGGFTLMELMVYIAIVGIVVIVAGQAFSNSTKMRVRTQSMLKASEVAENVAALFKQDIAQMGAKSSMENEVSEKGASHGNKFLSVCADEEAENNGGCVSRSIYMTPDSDNEAKKDSSSFDITTSNGFSDFVFRRARHDESGKYKSVEEVRWFVENGNLYRRCYTIAGEEDAEGSGATKTVLCKAKPAKTEDEISDAVEVATGVTTFSITAASPSTSVDNVQVFPTPCTPEPCVDEFQLLTLPSEGKNIALKVGSSDNGYEGGSSITLSQFYSNFSNTSGNGELLDEALWKQNQVIAIDNVTLSGTTSWKDRCAAYGIKPVGTGENAISLEAKQEYEISFEISYPGQDAYGHEDKSTMFVPGEDHMSVGLRSAATGGLLKKDGRTLVEDFMFYPPLNQEGAGIRSMRFSVDSPVNEAFCLSFTFASFSPLVSQGKVIIKDLRLKKIASSNYRFNPPFNVANVKEKKNVKAFQLRLQMKRNGESGEATLIVPTPGNGPRD